MTTAAQAGSALTDRLSQDVDAAFPELVDTYGRAVYTTALRMSGRPADAEDLAAETFLRAYRALRGYPPARVRVLQPRSWLITIVLNLWRNQVRAASRRPQQVPLEGPDEPRTRSGLPEEQLRRREIEAGLAERLADLPDNQRLAVVLRHVIGLSYGEVAAVLGCPEGTAKSHVSRGLQLLRTLIGDSNMQEELS
jgi:RNA polymerase sigma factor (sigma-70 family)